MEVSIILNELDIFDIVGSFVTVVQHYYIDCCTFVSLKRTCKRLYNACRMVEAARTNAILQEMYDIRGFDARTRELGNANYVISNFDAKHGEMRIICREAPPDMLQNATKRTHTFHDDKKAIHTVKVVVNGLEHIMELNETVEKRMDIEYLAVDLQKTIRGVDYRGKLVVVGNIRGYMKYNYIDMIAYGGRIYANWSKFPRKTELFLHETADIDYYGKIILDNLDYLNYIVLVDKKIKIVPNHKYTRISKLLNYAERKMSTDNVMLIKIMYE